MNRYQGFWVIFLFGSVLLRAQSDKIFSYGVEIKGHYRNSEAVKFEVPFRLREFVPHFLPPGETSFSVGTVDKGSHWEFSRVSLFLAAQFGPKLSANLKLDLIDKYEANPTSSDNVAHADEAWVQYGNEILPDNIPESGSFYLRLGKFGRFERQDDRNLESYGLVATAYNRFEDAGLEAGFDMGRYLYLKTAVTNGNPVFIRDANALAGDHGAGDPPHPVTNANPIPEYGIGLVALYDSEVEDFDFAEPEYSLALGCRFGSLDQGRVFNLMFYGNWRDLPQQTNISNSFYGGDLDLLEGVFSELVSIDFPFADDFKDPLPLDGIKKHELGVNLWCYINDFTLFVQHVDADIAGLGFRGVEAELAYSFDLPWTLGFAGKPFLYALTPAVRYSKNTPSFVGNALAYPSPSIWWDWEKYDYGFNVLLTPESKLTFEYSLDKFKTPAGWQDREEFLASLSVKWMSHRGDGQ